MVEKRKDFLRTMFLIIMISVFTLLFSIMIIKESDKVSKIADENAKLKVEAVVSKNEYMRLLKEIEDKNKPLKPVRSPSSIYKGMVEKIWTTDNGVRMCIYVLEDGEVVSIRCEDESIQDGDIVYVLYYDDEDYYLLEGVE